MIRHLARIGKDDLLGYNKINSTNTDNLLNSNDSDSFNKENMDDRFDDVLKVNKNNKNSDIYKKYEELIQQSNEEDSVVGNNAYANNASFYSALKPKSFENFDNEEIENIVEEKFDKSEIEPRDDVMFDLFNLNIKDSEEENLFEEKKLVNNKQKVINENSKVEIVEENKESDYSFQKDTDYNYYDTFSGLRKNKVKRTSKAKFDDTYNNDSPVTTVDLKNKIYASGYKIRTYQKLDSEGYYANRYYLNNKLNRDCSIITSVIMMFIVGMMWIAFDGYVNLPAYSYIIIMALFLILPFVSFIKYANMPKARKVANFSFKLAILNAIMAYLIITVVCLLVAFFAVGADISNISTMVCPLFYPMFILLVLPIYVIVYQLLYMTRKYVIE